MASLLGKHKISIEVSSLADGDSIASYLTDAAGNLLTSTLISGKQSLDVNVTESVLPTGAATQTTLALVLTELQALSQAEDVAHVSGDLGIMGLAVRRDANTSLVNADGDYAPLQVDANGALKVVGNITITDSAEFAEDSAHTSGDIGIFSLLVRQDTLAASTSADGDYGAFKSNSKGELYTIDKDAIAQLAQSYTELLSQGVTLSAILADTATIDSQTLTTSTTLAALSKAEDAVHVSGDTGIQALAVRKDASGSNVSADGDYSSLQTWSEGSLKTVDVSNRAILQQRISVTSTAAAVPAAALVSRKSLMIQNAGAASVWIGTSSVTASGATAGIEIPKGGFMELEVGPAVSVFAISAVAVNVNILEMS